MKVLVISPVFPYPPHDGDKLRIYNIIKQLAKKNKVYLAAFIGPGEEKNLKELKKFCARVETTAVSKSRMFFNLARFLLTEKPLNAAAYESKSMREKINRILSDENPEVVFTYRLRCAPFAENLTLPKVIDIVDSLALHAERRLEYEKNIFSRMYLRVDGPRLLKYEKKAGKIFDTVFINSQEEKEFLGLKNCVVALNGPAEPWDNMQKKIKDAGVFTVGFFGGMDYAPNLDAITWFYEKVWQKEFTPDKSIRLIIAGKYSEKLRGKIKGDNIEIKGLVSDIAEELSSWDLCVVPVRYATGKQNKIIQAWTDKVPVLASRSCAAAVFGKQGISILTADTPAEFSRQINQARKNPALLKKIAQGGFAAARKYFSWEKTGALIETAFKRAVKIR